MIPPQPFYDAFFAPAVHVYRETAIYESDGSTLFCGEPMVTGGNISADMTRDERRVLDLQISNAGCAIGEHDLRPYPGGMWYDKIIKSYRGVHHQGEVWKTQIGEFMIDQVGRTRSSKDVKITGRDYTKKLMLDKFPASTTFTAAQSPIAVMRAIALNGGITRLNFPINEVDTLGIDYAFEKGTTRWEALKKIATAFNYEIFFDPEGYLTLRLFQDPLLSGVTYTFKTGAEGTLVDIDKVVNDSRIRNHIVVYGTSEGTPKWGQAENNQASSPTRIAKLGRRTEEFTNPLVTTNAQARAIARAKLATMALESYEVNWTSMVAPWLEPGDIVGFEDPDPAPGDPSRYLLSSLSIPMTLEAMPALGKRVTVVV